LSDRQGAMLITSALQDANIINETDATNVVDRNKVRRERTKMRKTTRQPEQIYLRALYFDGRKDKTMIYSDGRKDTVVEEHIVIISEPGGLYLTHVSPKSGTAVGIVESIMNFLESNPHIVTDGLCAVGCDGTVVNTGTISFAYYFSF
jgi:hypothetical protein